MDHRFFRSARDAYVTGAAFIADPGEGGTIPVVIHGGTCEVSSGTRKLPVQPKAGISVTIFADEGEVTITDAASTAVITIPAGYGGMCVSDPNGSWVAPPPFEVGAVSVPPLVASAAQLQSRFDNDLTVSLTDAGGIPIDSTMDLDNGNGGLIEGAGAILPSNVVQARRNSHVYWTGSRGGSTPIFRFKRCHTTLRDFSIYGDSATNITNSVGQKADIGILVTKETDIGTGKVDAENIILSDLSIGVQFASAASESNCDESVWKNFVFSRCTKGVRMLSGNVLTHCFDSPKFHGVDCCFEILGGGHTAITGAPLYGYTESASGTCAFIRFKKTTPLEYGPNAGSFTVDNLKVDTAAIGLRLLDCDESTGGDYEHMSVRFNNLQPAYNGSGAGYWGGPLFYLSGKLHLVINGCSHLPNNSIRWDQAGAGFPTVTIRDAYCQHASDYEDLLDIGNSTGNIQIRMENCRTASANLTDTVGTVQVAGTG